MRFRGAREGWVWGRTPHTSSARLFEAGASPGLRRPAPAHPSAPLASLASPKERHYSLAVYILLRGVTLLIRTGNRPAAPPLLRALLAPTRMRHGDTALMCACCAQVSPARARGARGTRRARQLRPGP